MDVLLIPGFWLDGASWGGLPAALDSDGHRATALTLPGLERDAANRADIGIADQAAAVIAAIDTAEKPVAIVAHSGGGAVAGLAIDARPHAVDRVIYIDTWPTAEGGCVNDAFIAVDGEIPLPDWSEFDDEDLIDLDDDGRSRLRSIAVPEPERVATDAVHYSDDPARRGVPATVVATSRPVAEYRRYLEAGAPFFSELAALHEVTWVDLPTGHWPQLTRPADLTEVVRHALR